MKFIKPSEISSKIMTLIEESDEFVIIVSPYVKISKWYKLLKKIENLKKRNIPMEFYVREDKNNYNSFNELNQFNLKFNAVSDLHAKLYINEKYAIVGSMNLLLSSEINSLEIAYQTESEKEYNEAIEDLDLCLILEPGYAEAYYYRALSKLELGANKKACEDFYLAYDYGFKKAMKTIKNVCEEEKKEKKKEN